MPTMTSERSKPNRALGVAENPKAIAREYDAPLSGAPGATKVMVVHPIDDDLERLLGILSRCGCQVEWWATMTDAVITLNNLLIPVVICESKLSDGTWRDLLRQVSPMSCPPLVIVTSRLADDQLWAEVFNRGAYDLLMKPFDAREVARVVSLACRWWWLEYSAFQGGIYAK
jgi:FixJ family two-component response regulator